jgi:hypothetical protein
MQRGQQHDKAGAKVVARILVGSTDATAGLSQGPGRHAGGADEARETKHPGISWQKSQARSQSRDAAAPAPSKCPFDAADSTRTAAPRKKIRTSAISQSTQSQLQIAQVI